MKRNISRVFATMLAAVLLAANAHAIVLEQRSQAERYMLKKGWSRENIDNVLAILYYTDELATDKMTQAIMEKRNKLGSWEAAASTFGVDATELQHYVENKVKRREALTIPDPIYYEMVDAGMTDDECRDFGLRASWLGIDIITAWDAHVSGKSLEAVAKEQEGKQNAKDQAALDVVMEEIPETEYVERMKVIEPGMTEEDILKYAEAFGDRIVSERILSAGISEEEIEKGAEIGFTGIPRILELCRLKEAQNKTTNLTYDEMIEFVKSGYTVDDVVKGNIPQEKVDALRWAQMLGEEIPAADISRFDDIEEYAWAKDAINSLARSGVIRGTSESEFSPGKNITRADFALLLVRAFKLSSDNAENFSDVTAVDYFAPEVAVARNNGIIGGIGDNKFAPRNFITRQDMMVIAYRVFEKIGVEASPDSEETSAERYQDFESVAGYARDAVVSLVGAGLVNGKNGCIAPDEYTTRAEVAVLTDRMQRYIVS